MKFSKKLITSVILGFSLTSFHYTAWADTLDQGVTAYKQGDYQTAFKFWLPLAEQGNVRAQFNLGVMYEVGRGVKQDYFEAVKWFRKAAEQGVARAQLNLGVHYYQGHGVRQDKGQAKEWFGKACDNGDQQGCEYYAQLNRGEL